MDIVKFIQTQAESLGWFFSYGNTANHNLLESQKDIDKIYFLLDPVESDEPDVSEFGGDVDITHTIRFMLLVQSDIDNVYFEQKNVEIGKGKYDLNILPLKTQLKLFKDLIDCSIYQRTGWRTIDATNLLATNFDGLIINTVLRQNAD